MYSGKVDSWMEWRPQLALANLTPPNTNLLLIRYSIQHRPPIQTLFPTLFKNLTNEQISLPAVGSRYTEVMNSAQAAVVTAVVVAAVAAVGVTIANIVHLPPRSLKGLFAAVAAYSR